MATITTPQPHISLMKKLAREAVHSKAEQSDTPHLTEMSSEEQRDLIARDNNLLQYYVFLRRCLNDGLHVAQAVESGKIELKEETGSKVVSGIGKVASAALPGIGNIADVITSGISFFMREAHDREVAQESKGVTKLIPSHDSGQWSKFTREYATAVTAARSEEIQRTAAKGSRDGLLDRFKKFVGLSPDVSDIEAIAMRDAAQTVAMAMSGKLNVQSNLGVEDHVTREGVISQMLENLTPPSEMKAFKAQSLVAQKSAGRTV